MKSGDVPSIFKMIAENLRQTNSINNAPLCKSGKDLSQETMHIFSLPNVMYYFIEELVLWKE
jgi:hypothetical protein